MSDVSIDAAGAPAGASGTPAGSGAIDFRRPAPLVGRQHKALLNLHEELCERLAPMLSSRLRTPIRMTVAALDMAMADELQVVEEPSPLVAILDAPPLNGHLVMTLPPEFATSLADLLLGGTGRVDEPRTLSEVEVLVVASFLELWLPSFVLAWRQVAPIQPRIRTVFADPEAPHPLPEGEAVLRVNLALQLGDDQRDLYLWIPGAVLAAAFRSSDAPEHAATEPNASGARAMVIDVLRTVSVDVSVMFPPVPMTPAQILALEPGDVIRLHPVTVPLELAAGDVRIGWVRPAQHAGRTACQVLSLESARIRSMRSA